ncbi:skin secretory protein xP2-like [Schistocerca serialis cubense]|uniref:skin secretory protein xP2-like n=1 Tax=Schistocerca serialis cubense TaxID=2023355 RepID=UPI00214EB739|nr:skin secretory protein xP2-like [Schistocerca serialis cubense]
MRMSGGPPDALTGADADGDTAEAAGRPHLPAVVRSGLHLAARASAGSASCCTRGRGGSSASLQEARREPAAGVAAGATTCARDFLPAGRRKRGRTMPGAAVGGAGPASGAPAPRNHTAADSRRRPSPGDASTPLGLTAYGLDQTGAPSEHFCKVLLEGAIAAPAPPGNRPRHAELLENVTHSSQPPEGGADRPAPAIHERRLSTRRRLANRSTTLIARCNGR